jgi:hypothetical protein
MDHVKVLKRAWEILWRYRALWVFGVIVLLCAAGTSGNPTFNPGDGGGDNQANVPPWVGEVPWERTYELEEFAPEVAEALEEFAPELVAALAGLAGAILAIVATLCCLALVVTVIRVILLYISETALIRMVNEYEETGQKRGVREGFRLGWSRTALRLFIIDLLTRLPGLLIGLMLVILGAVALGWMFLVSDSAALMGVGVVAAIGLAFLTILAAIVLALGISLVRPLIFRVCAVEELGVVESIRVGFDFIKAHLADTVVMWLIMIGLHIGWAIAMIPVVLFLLLAGGVLGALAGLSVGGLSAFLFEGAVPWILGFGVGIPVFFLIVGIPSVFLGGLAEVYKSSVWTLTYRELRALEGLENDSGESAGLAESAA